jgi:hypothetical protein
MSHLGESTRGLFLGRPAEDVELDEGGLDFDKDVAEREESAVVHVVSSEDTKKDSKDTRTFSERARAYLRGIGAVTLGGLAFGGTGLAVAKSVVGTKNSTPKPLHLLSPKRIETYDNWYYSSYILAGGTTARLDQKEEVLADSSFLRSGECSTDPNSIIDVQKLKVYFKGNYEESCTKIKGKYYAKLIPKRLFAQTPQAKAMDFMPAADHDGIGDAEGANVDSNQIGTTENVKIINNSQNSSVNVSVHYEDGIKEDPTATTTSTTAGKASVAVKGLVTTSPSGGIINIPTSTTSQGLPGTTEKVHYIKELDTTFRNGVGRVVHEIFYKKSSTITIPGTPSTKETTPTTTTTPTTPTETTPTTTTTTTTTPETTPTTTTNTTTTSTVTIVPGG